MKNSVGDLEALTVEDQASRRVPCTAQHRQRALYALHTSPNHPNGVVDPARDAAEADDGNLDGKTTE